MIIDGMPLGEELAEIEVWGNPWHGTVSAGVLDTGMPDPANPGQTITRTYPQPDSGDCILVKVPGVPAVVRDESAALRDAANGHQWRDYALMSGWWHRRLYGKALAAGRLSWVCSFGVGKAYLADATGLVLSDVVDGGVSVRKLGGHVTLASTILQGVPTPSAIIEVVPVMLPTFLGSPATMWDVVSITPDGSRILIGLWPEVAMVYPYAYTGGVLAYTEGCKALARSEYHSLGNYGEPTGDYIARVVPYAMMALDLAMDEAGAITAALSVHKTWDDIWQYVTEVFSDVRGAQLGPCPGQIYSPYSSQDFTSTWRIDELIGISYNTIGVEHVIRLVWHSDDQSSAATVMGECGSTSTYTETSSGSSIGEIRIVVDGVVLSTIRVALTYSDTVVRDSSGQVTSTTHTQSTDITLDGVPLVTGSADNWFFSGLDNNGLNFSTRINLHCNTGGTITTVQSINIHCVRYSNNAYGFALIPYLGSLLTGPYRMGICNVVDGSRTAAPGYFTPPAGVDPIDYVYDGLDQVTVEPVSAQLERGASVCYV